MCQFSLSLIINLTHTLKIASFIYSAAKTEIQTSAGHEWISLMCINGENLLKHDSNLDTENKRLLNLIACK